MNRSFWIVVSIAVLLVLILVPLSFRYVDYYEYGLKRSWTGTVDTTNVYIQGRYFTGLGYRFVIYPADATSKSLESLSVFSAGETNSSVGLSFLIDVDYTYLLKKDSIGQLHQELASTYDTVIYENAKAAIKNEAIYVAFTEYFQNRTSVESHFRKAVEKHWASSNMPCTLDQFHLGRVQIPDAVAKRQLESRIQYETNDKESYLQQAQIERAKTSVLVNQIILNETKVKRTAEAEASLIRSKATAQAQQLLLEAQSNGTRLLVESAGIATQEQRTAFAYIRTLMNRNNITIELTNLRPENIVQTRPV